MSNENPNDADGSNGVTPLEYAAIMLRVEHPDVPAWLNEIIRKSRRDEFARAALMGMCVGVVGLIGGKEPISAYAKGPCNAALVDRAFVLADSMLRGDAP